MLSILLLLTLIVFSNPDSGNIEIRSIGAADTIVHADKSYGNLLENSKRINFNTASISQLQDAGFPNNVILNIKKYLEAGGRFKSVNDLKKIYGIDTVVINQISHRLDFDLNYSIDKSDRFENKLKSNLKNNRTAGYKFESAYDSNYNHHNEITTFKINLNSADTSQLMLLNGIGPVYSQRIIKYRNLIGGFYNANQLNEVYGITSELIEKITPDLYIDTTLIVQIDINKSSLRKLKEHPYIGFYKAKEIIEYRKQHGFITNLSIIKTLKSFTSEDVEKLMHYFKI